VQLVTLPRPGLHFMSTVNFLWTVCQQFKFLVVRVTVLSFIPLLHAQCISWYCLLSTCEPDPAAGSLTVHALAPPTSSIVALTVCVQLSQGCYAAASGQLNLNSRPQTREPGRLAVLETWVLVSRLSIQSLGLERLSLDLGLKNNELNHFTAYGN